MHLIQESSNAHSVARGAKASGCNVLGGAVYGAAGGGHVAGNGEFLTTGELDLHLVYLSQAPAIMCKHYAVNRVPCEVA